VPAAPGEERWMKGLLWFVLVLAVAMGAFFAGTKLATREAVFTASADGAHAAWVEDRRCWSGPCQALWIGDGRANATRVGLLEQKSRCDEVAWSKDGSRVAFLIDGTQLRFYNPASRAPAGQITLVTPPADGRAVAVVRGVTFSDNGNAITFDECPIGRSGCRAGFSAVPR
jgi:hypothetical protein